MRVLAPGDEPALARFFATYPDTTLFFQNNVAAAGLIDRGEPYHGTYAAAFDGARITALAAHFWNGNIILEAPVALEALLRTAIVATGRPVAGLLGPWSQVCAARSALMLAAATAAMDSPDDLFAVDLAALRVPAALTDGRLRCRSTHEAELEQVAQWRHDYSVELMGRAPDFGLMQRSRAEIAQWHGEGRTFVLEESGSLVSFAGYNAMTSICVQIGGVWTPPILRGRGYARAAVAGALLAARGRGVARSILFTGVTNRAAQAAYRALGYERVGDYGLVLFESPQRVR